MNSLLREDFPGLTLYDRKNLTNHLFIPLTNNRTYDGAILRKFWEILQSYKIKSKFVLKRKFTDHEITYYPNSSDIDNAKIYNKRSNAQARCNILNKKLQSHESHNIWIVVEIGVYCF